MTTDATSAVLPDTIYSALRSAIISQDIEPGESVTESAVALRFGVARPTAKTAIERLSKGFALELAESGIRVNVVEPGFAAGSEVSLLTEDYVANMLKRIPLGRQSGPDDAPTAIGFLCSDKASFITGAVLSVDGGNSIGTFLRSQPASGQ